MGVEAVLARRRAERTELIDRARRFVADVEAKIPLRAAVVFGSVARGDFNRWSDVDLLLIYDSFGDDWSGRLDLLGPIPALLQPFVWTVSEWHAELGRGNPIAREAVQDGVWLAGALADLGDHRQRANPIRPEGRPGSGNRPWIPASAGMTKGRGNLCFTSVNHPDAWPWSLKLHQTLATARRAR